MIDIDDIAADRALGEHVGHVVFDAVDFMLGRSEQVPHEHLGRCPILARQMAVGRGLLRCQLFHGRGLRLRNNRLYVDAFVECHG